MLNNNLVLLNMDSTDIFIDPRKTTYNDMNLSLNLQKIEKNTNFKII